MRLPTILIAFLTICSAAAQETKPKPVKWEATHKKAAQQTAIAVTLQPQQPGDGRRMGWSPKGAKIYLEMVQGSLRGSFELGPLGTSHLSVRLEKSTEAKSYDQLWVDRDRDGLVGEGELLTTKARERRKKLWSSFSTVVDIPVAGKSRGLTRPYPLNFWYVFDPSEAEAKPVLRWSRRGWHQGEAMLGKTKMHVLITERKMDGRFDRSDSWALATDASSLFASSQSRSLSTHAWFGERAFRVTAIDPNGFRLELTAFDPGITRAEEIERNDKLAPDRRAKRALKALTFHHDFKLAAAEALTNNKMLFLDFETTWCGPCAAMSKWVYTAESVVAAATASQIIAVKIDGDEQKDLVKRFGVKAYPTMILLSPDGKVLRSARGYRSVAEMTEFFASARSQKN